MSHAVSQLGSPHVIWMYTSTGRGADLGGDWGSSDKRLKALDISDSDYLTMFPAFSPDVHEYVIPLHADLDGTAVRRAHVVPTAMNKQYQVHAYVGDEEILPRDTLFIANGMYMIRISSPGLIT